MKQMNRIFSSKTDMSVGEYIIYKRLAQAIVDLRYTNLPIIQIAQKNGFATQESFTRALKHTFNVTPYYFRQKQQFVEDTLSEKLTEVIEETSHEIARISSIELPNPQVHLIHKPTSLWYSIARNTQDLFPHDFYVQCKKNHIYEKINHMNIEVEIGGAYLTHVYKGQKFSSLTLGFEEVNTNNDMKYEEVTSSVIPEADYLVVNVPPYKNYELGAHVLAAWNVFSEFDYHSCGLKRDPNYAPIYEWDNAIEGYTLFFPVKIL